MGYREVQNYKAFMAEEAERERLEQEQRERPLREAEAQLVQNSNALAMLERDRVAGTGGLKDERSWADPIIAGTRMLRDEAKAYNAAQFQVFMRDHPSAYLSPANADVLFSYLTRNDITIATAETYRRAYERLDSFGLLESKPADPEPELVQEPEPESTGPKMVKGWDDDGREIELTERQVDRLTADEYKTFARVSVQRFPSHAAF